MSTFTNLVQAPIPGYEYLMPDGIGGLRVGIPGDDFGFGSMQSLYHTPPGIGDAPSQAPNPYGPREGELTDAEASIVVHVCLSPMADGSHLNMYSDQGDASECLNGSFLFKHVPTFILREPCPADISGEDRPSATQVPIYYLNAFLKAPVRLHRSSCH